MKKSFLYEDVYKKILTDINTGHYSCGEELPKEKELCEMYFVSLITVRRALKELEDRGIVTKIRGKGTIVSDKIRSISDQSAINRNLGVLEIPFEEQDDKAYGHIPGMTDDINRNEWTNLIYSSMYRTLSNDFNIIISMHTQSEVLNNFDNTVFTNVERLLVIGNYNKEIIDFLHKKGKLVIVYNNFDRNINVCSVTTNEREACREAVEMLLQKGHRRIAAINGSITFSESVERAMGYQEALLNNSVFVNSKYIKWGDMTAESGYYFMKQFLAEPERPTAVFCANDNVAAGAYLALKEQDIRCPEDICIIGHDNNILVCRKVGMRFTSIDPRFSFVGEEIAEKLTREVWIDDLSRVTCKIVYQDSTD